MTTIYTYSFTCLYCGRISGPRFMNCREKRSGEVNQSCSIYENWDDCLHLSSRHWLNNMSELQHLSEHSLNVKIYLILNTFPYISYHWTFIERQCTGIFLFSSTFLQDFSRPKMWLITLKSSKPQSFWCSNFSTVRAENCLEKDRQLVVVIWSTFTNATPIIQMLKRWRIADPSSPLWF